MWERWRRPVLVVLGGVVIVNQWERFASGQPFVIATGIGVAAFWVSLLFSRSLPDPDSRTNADAWRAHARRRLMLFGFWFAVVAAWLVLAGALYSVRPVNFVGLAFPSLLMLSAWWTHRKADRIAELQREAHGV